MGFLDRLPIDRWEKWFFTILLCLLLAYCSFDQWHYSKSVTPNGVTTVSDFYNRFGTPVSIETVEQKGTTYYRLSSQNPQYTSKIQSAPPAYIFDSSGHLVDWCSDPGDDGAFLDKWYHHGQHIDPAVFQKKFGIKTAKTWTGP